MISALPTGVELTIQLSAPPVGRLDGSDVAVRILAGPSTSVPIAGGAATPGMADPVLEPDEWRLVMHELFTRIADMLGTTGAASVGTPPAGVTPRLAAYDSERFPLPALVRQGPAPQIREALHASREALSRVAIGDLEIDIPAHRVTQQGRQVMLTRQEFALLLVLLNRAGEVVSREELRHELWDHDFPEGSRALDQCIFKLRRKLERDPRAPRYLHCIRGIGYRFDAVLPDREQRDAAS